MYENQAIKEGPAERNPDGLSNLCDQAVDRAQSLIDRLEKLAQYLSPVLVPEPPMAAGGGGGLNRVTATSPAQDRLQTLLTRLEQAGRVINSITERFTP